MRDCEKDEKFADHNACARQQLTKMLSIDSQLISALLARALAGVSRFGVRLADKTAVVKATLPAAPKATHSRVMQARRPYLLLIATSMVPDIRLHS